MSDRRLPNPMVTERLTLRAYTKEDAAWYYQMSLRNRDHLCRYESGNVAMSLTNEDHARVTLGTLANYWSEGVCYFVGAFKKAHHEFVAQVYVGPFSVDPVDFIIGYIAERNHEGQGYVTEAVTAIVSHLFSDLGADQVRIHCDETNERSRRVAERCAFRLEKMFPEEKRGPDGQPELCSTAIYLQIRRKDTSR